MTFDVTPPGSRVEARANRAADPGVAARYAEMALSRASAATEEGGATLPIVALCGMQRCPHTRIT